MKKTNELPKVVRNEKKFKVGDIVKYAPYYFDKAELKKNDFHTVVATEVQENEATSGLWIKTHKIKEFVDAHWFVPAKIRWYHKLMRFFGLKKVPRQIKIKIDPNKIVWKGNNIK